MVLLKNARRSTLESSVCGRFIQAKQKKFPKKKTIIREEFARILGVENL